MKVNVQFADNTRTVIVASFGCPQSDEIPNQGVVDDESDEYKGFINSFGDLDGQLE